MYIGIGKHLAIVVVTDGSRMPFVLHLLDCFLHTVGVNVAHGNDVRFLAKQHCAKQFHTTLSKSYYTDFHLVHNLLLYVATFSHV